MKVTTIKEMILMLKTLFNIDFNKTPYHRLIDESVQAFNNNDLEGSNRLYIAADIKELLTDYISEREDRNFKINSLLELM